MLVCLTAGLQLPQLYPPFLLRQMKQKSFLQAGHFMFLQASVCCTNAPQWGQALIEGDSTPYIFLLEHSCNILIRGSLPPITPTTADTVDPWCMLRDCRVVESSCKSVWPTISRSCWLSWSAGTIPLTLSLNCVIVEDYMIKNRQLNYYYIACFMYIVIGFRHLLEMFMANKINTCLFCVTTHNCKLYTSCGCNYLELVVYTCKYEKTGFSNTPDHMTCLWTSTISIQENHTMLSIFVCVKWKVYVKDLNTFYGSLWVLLSVWWCATYRWNSKCVSFVDLNKHRYHG